MDEEKLKEIRKKINNSDWLDQACNKLAEDIVEGRIQLELPEERKARMKAYIPTHTLEQSMNEFHMRKDQLKEWCKRNNIKWKESDPGED